MLTTAIAVLGTLLGAVVAGLFQQKTASRAEQAATAAQLRRERLDAVTTLAAAGSDHRRAMYMRGEALLGGAPGTRLEELRAASHATRSAITQPLVAVQILIPDATVRAAAKGMVVAAYRMRDAESSTEELTAAREAARTAHDEFVDVAAAYLTTA
ncbi:hypothetical protein OG298_45735 (plasmid) [Streptomyces sp. NBC_01005]|uniref:hypothetical protein n=1 Tax=Streptomyces sp. NBC_01005 TaxID=2903715 RepID=UPI002F9199E3|nr:hypothetical protein OG298_45840 [Streptomyces sp. NBC_01005]WSW11549.1 hypothetical protein OG298_45735 [Streptomyces sp. NBC_01005]